MNPIVRIIIMNNANTEGIGIAKGRQGYWLKKIIWVVREKHCIEHK